MDTDLVGMANAFIENRWEWEPVNSSMTHRLKTTPPPPHPPPPHFAALRLIFSG
jgi:hypothetical protein